MTAQLGSADGDYESSYPGLARRDFRPAYDPPERCFFNEMTKADLSVHVDCQPFADSYAAVLGEIVPVANRADAGVVVGGDRVEGVALLDLMDDTDGLRRRD